MEGDAGVHRAKRALATFQFDSSAVFSHKDNSIPEGTLLEARGIINFGSNWLSALKIKISNSTCQVGTEAKHEQGAGGCRSALLASSGVCASPIGEPEISPGAREHRGCPALEIIPRLAGHGAWKIPTSHLNFCVQTQSSLPDLKQSRSH